MNVISKCNVWLKIFIHVNHKVKLFCMKYFQTFMMKANVTFCTKAVLEVVTRGVLEEKVFSKILQNSQENAWRLATLLKKRLWHRCFPVNVAKFLRTRFLQNTSGGCFCVLSFSGSNYTFVDYLYQSSEFCYHNVRQSSL